MSSAGRPTYFAAKGNATSNSRLFASTTSSYSVKDIPSQTTLKFRNEEEDDSNSYRLNEKELRRRLIEKERQIQTDAQKTKYDRILAEEANVDVSGLRNLQAAMKTTSTLKAANDSSSDDSDSESEKSSDDSDQDDSSDDEKELQAELERVRRERREKEARSLQTQQEMLVIKARTGNPLIKLEETSNQTLDARIRRKWNDDVMFRNQAPTYEEEKAGKKRKFVNDTVRNDFHRKFLHRYVT